MADENRFRNADPERQRVAREASEVVKQAASILQKELTDSSGLASEMQQKFRDTRRVDHGEFKVLADRVRKDVHDLIAIASEMFSELRTEEVQSLVTRISTDAHDVVDTAMNLVEHTPDAATRFAGLGFTTPVPSGDALPPEPGAEALPPEPGAEAPPPEPGGEAPPPPNRPVVDE
jgi:hypothetical protein